MNYTRLDIRALNNSQSDPLNQLWLPLSSVILDPERKVLFSYQPVWKPRCYYFPLNVNFLCFCIFLFCVLFEEHFFVFDFTFTFLFSKARSGSRNMCSEGKASGHVFLPDVYVVKVPF